MKKTLPLGGTTRLASALALALALIALSDWAKVNGVDVMGGGTILTESRLRSLPDNHTWQFASSAYGASRCGPAGHHHLDSLLSLVSAYLASSRANETHGSVSFG